MKHIVILDGIRAYAILMVCIAHFFQVDESALYESNKIMGVLLFKFSQLGLTGVELFFIISGFLITNILLGSKGSRYYYSIFFVRRMLRIFPLYYFVLFISFYVIPEIYDPDGAGRNVIANQWLLWTYLSNISFVFDEPASIWDASSNFPHFGHLWSLAVEEHFYLLWPFVIARCSSLWMPHVMLGLAATSVLIKVMYWWTFHTHAILGWGTLQHAGTLALGGWIALKWREPDAFNRCVYLARKFVLPAAFFFLLQTFIPRYLEFKPIARQIACLTLYPAVLILALAGSQTAVKLFCHEALYFVGKISYGIYIYHGWMRPYFKEYVYKICTLYLSDGVAVATVYTLICTVISIGVAWVSWTLLEAPLLQYKKFFSYR